MMGDQCVTEKPLFTFVAEMEALCDTHPTGAFPAHVRRMFHRVAGALRVPLKGKSQHRQCIALVQHLKYVQAGMDAALKQLHVRNVAALVDSDAVLGQAAKMMVDGRPLADVVALLKRHTRPRFRTSRPGSSSAMRALTIAAALLGMMMFAAMPEATASTQLPPATTSSNLRAWTVDSTPVLSDTLVAAMSDMTSQGKYLLAAADVDPTPSDDPVAHTPARSESFVADYYDKYAARRYRPEIYLPDRKYDIGIKLPLPTVGTEVLPPSSRAWYRDVLDAQRNNVADEVSMPNAGIHGSTRLIRPSRRDHRDAETIGYVKVVSALGAAREQAAMRLFRAVGMSVPQVLVSVDKRHDAAKVLTEPVKHGKLASAMDWSTLSNYMSHSVPGQLMALLDAASGNFDRHSYNFMIDTKMGQLVPIDNDNMFSSHRTMHSPIAPSVMVHHDTYQALKALLTPTHEPTEKLRTALAGLPSGERDTFVAGLQALVKWMDAGVASMRMLVLLVNHPSDVVSFKDTAPLAGCVAAALFRMPSPESLATMRATLTDAVEACAREQPTTPQLPKIRNFVRVLDAATGDGTLAKMATNPDLIQGMLSCVTSAVIETRRKGPEPNPVIVAMLRASFGVLALLFGAAFVAWICESFKSDYRTTLDVDVVYSNGELTLHLRPRTTGSNSPPVIRGSTPNTNSL